MPVFAANIKSGDLVGVKVSDGIYLMNDNKMYVEKFDTDQTFETIEDGEEFEVSSLALTLALNYAKKTANRVPLGSDEDVEA